MLCDAYNVVSKWCYESRKRVRVELWVGRPTPRCEAEGSCITYQHTGNKILVWIILFFFIEEQLLYFITLHYKLCKSLVTIKLYITIHIMKLLLRLQCHMKS